MRYLTFSIASLCIAILFSCRSEQKSACPTVDYVNSFLAENDKIVFYGGVAIDDLLQKTGLLSVSGIGESFGDQIENVKLSLALDERVYFALGGPLDRQGMPSSIYFFVHVRNKLMVRELLEENGYYFDDDGGIMVAEDVTSAIGFTDDLLIAVSGEYGEDFKAMLLEAFSVSNEKKSNQKIEENLARKGDVLFVSHLENLYTTSNTDLNKLPNEQQEEIARMTEGSHIAATLSFETGKMVLEAFVKGNEAMDRLLVFNEAPPVDVPARLGPGLGYAGLSLNLNMQKVDALMNDFNVDIMGELVKEAGPVAKLIRTLIGDKLSSIINGSFGMALMSRPGSVEFAKNPKLHVYFGMGKSSELLAELFADLLAAGNLEKQGEGVYLMDKTLVKIEQNEMVMWTGFDQGYENIQFSPLDVPKHIPNFGNKPFSMYIDISDMELEKLGVDQMIESLAELGSYISLEANNEGGRMVIQLKNTEENFLRALVKGFQNEIEALTSQGSMAF
jgi:hypothetical protein